MNTSTLNLLNGKTDLAAQQLAGAYFSHLGLLQFISLIISAILFAAVIAIVVRTGWFSLRVDRFRDVILRRDLSKDVAQKSWKQIEDHFYRGDENDLKIAIIEADKLLEEALRHAGIRGMNLGERLKNLKPNQFPNLDDLWQAHRLRNQIVHEPTFKLKRDLAERALKIYEDTLKRFHLLD